MDEKEQKVITFKLSAEKAEALDSSAAEAGMNRTEYICARLFTPPPPAIDQLEALIKHAIYTIARTHNALYSIAEEQGKLRRFLTTEELGQIYDRVRAETLKYAVEFPNSLAAFQAEIAAMSQQQEA